MASRQSILSSGTSVEGQLQSSIDVKKIRVGDRVTLKTTKSIKQNGQVAVPKGSKLIGRVTEVQQKTESNGMSKTGMVFERLENKDMSLPFSASITSITNIASGTRLDDTANSDLFGSTVGGITGTAGVLNTTTQTVGGVTNTAGQTVGHSVGTVGRKVNGIQNSDSVSGSAQSGTTLSVADKNIRFDKGVTFQ